MYNYFVIFNINKYDLFFVFSFRKMSKYFKNVCEYNTTSLANNFKEYIKHNNNRYNITKFFNSVNILKFTYLKKICIANTKHEQHLINIIEQLHTLKYIKLLVLSHYDLTDNCINMLNLKALSINNRKKFNLHTLNVYKFHSNKYYTLANNINLYSSKNTNIDYMYIFDLCANKHTNNNIMCMFLHTIKLNNSITFDTIKNMHIYKLETTPLTIDKTIKNLDIIILKSYSYNITNSVFKNKNYKRILVFHNDNINDNAFVDKCIYKLTTEFCLNITNNNKEHIAICEIYN